MTSDRADLSAADWITIWQSEWAALATDREVQEGWQRAADAWAAAAAACIKLAGADAAPGCARPEPPPRPPAAADASAARDADMSALLARVDELERRLADLAAS